MKHVLNSDILSRQIRDNELFEVVYDDLMDRFQDNADRAALEDDKVRLEAAVARRTLRLFKEQLLHPSRHTLT